MPVIFLNPGLFERIREPSSQSPHRAIAWTEEKSEKVHGEVPGLSLDAPDQARFLIANLSRTKHWG